MTLAGSFSKASLVPGGRGGAPWGGGRVLPPCGWGGGGGSGCCCCELVRLRGMVGVLRTALTLEQLDALAGSRALGVPQSVPAVMIQRPHISTIL